jgi:uncharacterized protein (TIGR04255 family)
MRDYFGEFGSNKYLKGMHINLQMSPGQSEPTTTQTVSFERVQAFSQKGDLCVQAGRDVLVLNQLAQETWGGYSRLRDAAVSAAQKYTDFRGFDELAAVSLHYRDIVEIPRRTDPGIELRDWFRVYPEVPEDSFGSMGEFTFAVKLPSMCEDAVAVLSIQSVPLVAEDNPVFRFALDWHVSSADKIDNLDDAKQWLDGAHRALRSSFEKAFTPECLALFGLKEGE